MTNNERLFAALKTVLQHVDRVSVLMFVKFVDEAGVNAKSGFLFVGRQRTKDRIARRLLHLPDRVLARKDDSAAPLICGERCAIATASENRIMA
jgi:hypothetical protein